MDDHEATIDTSKAKTHKGRVYLKSKEPKLQEDDKHCLFINTNKSNEILRMVLTDLVRNIFKTVHYKKRLL